MSDVISVELLDSQTAVSEALDESRASTRADFFRKAIVGGGAFAAGGVLIAGLPSIALGQKSASQDKEILNFALLLEYLESEFYVEAVDRGALSGETLEFARVVRDHELAHVEFLRSALGNNARSKPQFDFKGTTSDADMFRATSVVLEDTGVQAYLGQAPRLRRQTLPAAVSIVSVEARHASWIRRIVGKPDYDGRAANYPAPAVLDSPLTRSQVESRVQSTGFIQG